MSVDLVVSGKSGTAARTTPRDRVRLFGVVVDEWQLHAPPAGQGPVNAVNIAAIETAGRDMVLVVSSVEPALRDQCEWLGLPVAMAAHLLVADLMPVDDHEHARAVMRELARAAVDGTLPITLKSPGWAGYYARRWAAANRMMCALIGPTDRASAEPVGAGAG